MISASASGECETTLPDFDFDEYGFLIPRGDQDGLESRSHEYSAQPNHAITESWTAVCNLWTQLHEKDSPQKVRQLLRKEVPRQLRSQVWQLFLNSNVLGAQSTFDYQLHLSELQSKLQSLDLSNDSNSVNMRKLNLLVDKLSKDIKAGGEIENLEEGACSTSDKEDSTELMCWARTTRQIMMDIVRTFPYHQLFMGEATEAKRSLLHILMLYSTQYNKTVGYCQGMAYVAALLLMNNISEEDAFWALVSLFERSKYLAGFYDSSLSKIKTHADVFGLLLKERLPQLGLHLESLGVHPLIYVTSWFMCLFTTLPCWDTVLTICDLLFLEGINTIFRAALAIMEVCSAELLAMYQIGDVIPFLQNIPSRLVSLKSFSRVLWQTTVHKWEVELYQDMVLKGNMVDRDAGSGRSQDGEVGETRRDGTRKRRAASWKDEDDGGEKEPSSKRRKADGASSVATPTTSSQSLFSRLVSAITPANRMKHPAKTAESTPQLSTIHTPGTTNRSKFKTPSARPRTKRPYNKANSTLNIRVTSMPGGEKGIEMKDFSASLRRRESNGKLTTTDCSTDENKISHLVLDSETGIPSLELDCQLPVTKNRAQISSEEPHLPLQAHSVLSGIPALELDLQSPVTKNSAGLSSNLQTLSDGHCDDNHRILTAPIASPIANIHVRSPLRRSMRIAKRRSIGQRAQSAGHSSPLLKDGSFPLPYLLSPRLERPLQDYVQSTTHPWDHHAFKTFSTPTPLRVIQVTDKSGSTIPVKGLKSADSATFTMTSPAASPWQPTTAALIHPAMIRSPEVELQPLTKKH